MKNIALFLAVVLIQLRAEVVTGQLPNGAPNLGKPATVALPTAPAVKVPVAPRIQKPVTPAVPRAPRAGRIGKATPKAGLLGKIFSRASSGTAPKASRAAAMGVISPSTDQNYVMVTTPMETGIVDADPRSINQLLTGQVSRQISYLDGLGRTIEAVIPQGSPGGQDVVRPVIYDAMGRTPVEYLPFTNGSTGSYQQQQYALGIQSSFYGASYDKIANDPNPYATTAFDNSALGRVVEQTSVGADWQQGSGHTTRYNYLVNQANQVRCFVYDASTNTWTSTFYAAGQVTVRNVRDENDHISSEFSDNNGRLVLKRIQVGPNSSDVADTYYGYDDFGNVALVIQPEGSAVIPIRTTAWTLSPDFLTSYCFTYRYDARRRLLEKSVPGGGTTWYVYNLRDQLILTQDANGHDPNNLDAYGRWLFTKYDKLGRPVMTGIYRDVQHVDRARMQQQANTAGLSWEMVVSGRPSQIPGHANVATVKYTLNNFFPLSIVEADVLTRTFYDTYDYEEIDDRNRDFLGYEWDALLISDEPGQPSFYVTGEDVSSQLRGLVTARQERELESQTWLTTVYYYDDNDRVIQTVADHLDNGSARTTLKYNFTGNVVQSCVVNAFPEAGQLATHTIYQEMQYDHAQRLVSTAMKVDDQPKLLLATQEYNELGQLVDKKLHSVDQGQSYLQSVDYRYNIRGWLEDINNRNLDYNQTTDNDPNEDSSRDGEDLFGLEIKYNKGQNLSQSVPQYNGNISEVLWRTGNPNTWKVLRGYSYGYDPMDRLIKADYRTYEDPTNIGNEQWGVYGTDYSVNGITYDLNGNLLALNRRGVDVRSGQHGVMDALTYFYSPEHANRLVGVDDRRSGSPMVHDFEDNGFKYLNNLDAEYLYDANGNMVQDRNKGLGIRYNYLNLPIEIETKFGAIDYTYTATGRKLRKEIKLGSGAPLRTDYVGGFIYVNGQLQSAPTPEGRLIFDPNPPHAAFHWKYEYHLRDHLGNLRFAFRSDGDDTQQRYSAGMEPVNARQEEADFANVSETRLRDAARARTGDYVARLNARTGRRLGPNKKFAVRRGDSLLVEVFARYDVAALPRWSSVGAAVTTMGSNGTGEGQPGAKPGTLRRLRNWLGIGVGVAPGALQAAVPPTPPQAYLLVELYGADSQLVQTDTKYLQLAATGEWQQLESALQVQENGYAIVRLINESDRPAYFDDLKVESLSPQYQENHYDPFGLNLVGIEDEGAPDYKFQFNGQEKQDDLGLYWNDHGARYLDLQLGRWWSVDPLGDISFQDDLSLYQFAFNNPLSFADPTGLCPTCPDGASFGDTYQWAGHTFMYDGKDWVYTVPGETEVEASQSDVVNAGGGILGDWSDEIHTGLDVVGTVVPVAGDALDLVNAGLYLLEGNKVDAATSAFGAIPVLGSVAPIIKIANRVKRPARFRKGVVEAVWEAAKKLHPEGKVFDPTTGAEILWDGTKPRNWDMGHVPDKEWHKLRDSYINGEINWKKLLDEYNNPANYRPELPSPNRANNQF